MGVGQFGVLAHLLPHEPLSQVLVAFTVPYELAYGATPPPLFKPALPVTGAEGKEAEGEEAAYNEGRRHLDRAGLLLGVFRRLFVLRLRLELLRRPVGRFSLPLLLSSGGG